MPAYIYSEFMSICVIHLKVVWCELSSHNRRVMDVVVIGCGASGVAALRRLHDAGLKVLGLEAADRIGGRIHTVEFGECNIDIGAAWCIGEKDNVVFELANPLDLLGRPDKDNKWFVLSNGDLVPTETSGEIIGKLRQAVSDANKNIPMSVSEYVENAAKNNELQEKGPELIKSFVEWYERNDRLGGQNDPQKGTSLKALEEHWRCEGQLLNWKGKGYKMILDVLLNKYPDPTKEVPVQILLNKEVDKIEWGENRIQSDPGAQMVHVKCKDGSLYTAKSVVVTVSVGVLKERHAQLFNPPLPAEKINTINNLQLCILDKIYIEFTEPWWPKTPANFTVLWRDEDKATFSDNEKWITEIYTINTIAYQPNVLLCWIYGNGAERMEKVSEDEVRTGVDKLLDLLFKKHFHITPVKSILRSQWASNPLVRCAYAYRSVLNEINGGNAIVLSEPLYQHGGSFPIVCFGGEATSHHRHTDVHGAVEAGFKEADRLIECFNKKA